MNEDNATVIDDDNNPELDEVLNAIYEGKETPSNDDEIHPEEEIKPERNRDEKGKFVKQESQQEVIEPENQGLPDQKAEIPPIQKIQSPKSLKKEIADKYWDKLDPELQEALAKRDEDFQNGIEIYKSRAQFAEIMEKALMPHMATMNALGVTPDLAVKELLGIDHLLRYGSEEQKAIQFAKIAHQFKPNFELVNQYLQNGMPAPDPRDQRLDRIEQALYQQTQFAQQQENSLITAELSKFAADPSHKHYEAVKPHMAALLQAGQANDLQDAYDQAIYANPATRALVLAEQQAAERTEATRKAKEARQAASVNTPRRPALQTAAPAAALDDELNQTWERLVG